MSKSPRYPAKLPVGTGGPIIPLVLYSVFSSYFRSRFRVQLCGFLLLTIRLTRSRG